MVTGFALVSVSVSGNKTSLTKETWEGNGLFISTIACSPSSKGVREGFKTGIWRPWMRRVLFTGLHPDLISLLSYTVQ